MTNLISLSVARSNRVQENLDASQACSPGLIKLNSKESLTFLDVNSAKFDQMDLLVVSRVHVPNASAGHYLKISTALGCTRVVEWCTSSSAGDWTFLVKRHGDWFFAHQECLMDGGFEFTISSELLINTFPFIDGDEGLIELMNKLDPEYFS